MIRYWFWAILALMIVCLFPIALIRALPYNDNALSVLLDVPADCSAPCFMGVRPGVTRAAEALEMVRQHAWVADARMNASGRGYADIRWDWSGAQSNLIDTVQPARMTFYWDREDAAMGGPEDAVIETISFYTHIRIYDAQTWLGSPDAGGANARLDDLIGYSAAYHRPPTMFQLSASLPCPMKLLSYWDARAKITMSVGYITSQYIPLSSLMETC